MATKEELLAELRSLSSPSRITTAPVQPVITADTQQPAANTQQLLAELRQLSQAQPTQAPQAIQTPQPTEKPGISDLFTGKSRTTPELEAIPEIGDAPELNQLSLAAAKSSLGLMTTGDQDEAKKILQKQFGDNVSFSADSKGNTIVNFPSGRYALNKPGFSPQDFAQLGFSIGAFSPAAKAKKMRDAALASGATQGVIEALQTGLGGDFNPKDIASAGLLSGFFKGAEDLIGAGYRAVKGSADNQLVSKAEEVGIPIMTSDVLENQTGLQRLVSEAVERVPFVGTAGLRQKQQIQREAAVNDIAQRYGQFSYDAIVDSLKEQKNKIKKLAGGVLGKIGKELDTYGTIPLDNTDKAIKEAKDQFTRRGIIQSGPATRDLNTVIQAVQSAPQTFSTLTENKQVWREILAGADKPERTQLSSKAKALLTQIEIGMKKDLINMAKEKLTPREFTRWNKANAVYEDEAIKLTKSRLKNVLDKGDITPESARDMLFSRKPSEVKSLFMSLTDEGRNNARAAIISDVVDTLSKRVGGITPNTFEAELKKRGLSTQVFFRDEKRKHLNGLLDVLNATRRAQDSVVTTPTGQSLLVPGGVGFLSGGSLESAAMTIGATLTAGFLGQVYERPTVRNALIRLANTPKGSTAYEQTLRKTMDEIARVSQALRQSEASGNTMTERNQSQ